MGCFTFEHPTHVSNMKCCCTSTVHRTEPCVRFRVYTHTHTPNICSTRNRNPFKSLILLRTVLCYAVHCVHPISFPICIDTVAGAELDLKFIVISPALPFSACVFLFYFLSSFTPLEHIVKYDRIEMRMSVRRMALGSSE